MEEKIVASALRVLAVLTLLGGLVLFINAVDHQGIGPTYCLFNNGSASPVPGTCHPQYRITAAVGWLVLGGAVFWALWEWAAATVVGNLASISNEMQRVREGIEDTVYGTPDVLGDVEDLLDDEDDDDDEPEDDIERLRGIGELHERGVLTDEEFARMKSDILQETDG